MSWAVVRVRGSVNVKPKIKETMKLMRLNRVNHCVIIPENETYTGMLKIINSTTHFSIAFPTRELSNSTKTVLLKSNILLPIS